MSATDARGAQVRRHGRQDLARFIGLGALLLVILACGAPPPREMIPVATLEPDILPFRVVSLAGDVLQSRAGRDAALQWQSHVGSTSDALLSADPDTHVIYVTASSTPMVTAVNPSNGYVLWQFSACTGSDPRILLGQGRLYLTCDQSALVGPDDVTLATIYALDARTGAILWKAAHQHARAIAGKKLIAQTPEGLAALDAGTGAIVWQHRVAIGPMVPAIGPYNQFRFVVDVDPNGLYYSPDGAYAEALRVSDGRLLWRSGPLQDMASAPNDTYTQHALVAVVTATTVVTQGIYGVTVLSTRDGSVLWRYFSYPNGEGITTLVGEDGTVYVEGYSGHAVSTPTDDQGGRNMLAALNPRDGSVRWQVVGAFALYPLLRLDRDTLLTSEPGEVSAFRTTDGTRRWRQEWASGDYLTATSNAVAVQADTTLYLLKLTDGLKVWKQELPAPGRATPLLLPA